MDEQPGSVEATASLVALALADAPAGDLMQQSFSLMVLDFDRDLFLISRGGVTRDGQGANAAMPAKTHLLDLFTRADRPVVLALIDEALAGRPGMITLAASRARQIRLSLLPRWVGEVQVGVVLTLQDITARREGIERLKALEDRLRAILDYAADAIIVIDIEGVIEAANAASEQLSGWSEAELVGRQIQTLMAEPYRSSHQGQIERYLNHGVSGILNVGPRPLPLLHKDGRTVPIELSVGEAVIAGERKFIGVCRDITLRLQTDEALRAANAELRGKIEELQILGGEQERQAQTLRELAIVAQAARGAAESANLAKSRFLATMSHELRTPLNGVLAVADALSRRNLAPPDLELVRIIQSSGQGLLSILNEVLDLARVEAGALVLDNGAFSPADLVRDVADVWRFAAQAKGIGLRVRVSRLPQAVVGDAQRLRQVLSNLINNAIKFTDQGGVVLIARWRPSAGILHIEVSDSGLGIDEASRERLFEPFVQADAGKTRRYGGTGLGLTICRELVQLMGGRIWADRAKGGGARIICELPFEVGELDGAQPQSIEVEKTLCIENAPLILVAEDHPLNRLVASLVLGEAGLAHEFAEDGEAAVEAVRTGRFNMVLMDVHMPKMDGLAASRAIRDLPKPAGGVPIIAVTANAAADEIADCLAAGMDDFVPKPISAAELLHKMALHLEPGRRPRGEAAA